MSTKLIEKTDTVTRTMPMYRVIIHNDDVNSMDHVILALQETFKMELEECIMIMLEAHKTGAALCRVEPMELAEHHRDILKAFSLSSTIEPE